MRSVRKYGPLVGRVLIATPFLYFGAYKLSNWEMMTGWLQFKGLPAQCLLLGAATLIEIVGGLLLLTGFKTRWVAVTLLLYLLPVHFFMHMFWVLEGIERQAQFESFLKGLMIIGGLVFVFTHGPGAVAIDNRSRDD